MNAFRDTASVMADVPNGFDELRIIAQDERRLTKQDRDTINRCADEWESHQRYMCVLLSQLIEVNAHRMAQNERILDLTKLTNMTFPKISTQIVARM